MIPRRTIVNLVTFLLVAGVLIVYGFVSLVHNPLARQRTLATVFSDTGGLKPGFSVTMRGVPIGSVESLKLVHNGVRVTMTIQAGAVVPGDVAARVQRANPLGEQQLDLVPLRGGTAPPLPDGATVPDAPDPVPPAVGDVVDAANRLFDTIPTQDLGTLVHETAVALSGRSQDLRTIIDSIDTASRNLLQYQDGFRALLANAPPVLDSVSAVGPQLRQALANTIVLTDLLARRRYDLVQLLDNSAAFGQVGTELLDSESPNLSCLIHDLADVGANLGTQPNLGNVDTTLQLNQYFFGPINSITPQGAFASLGKGSPTRNTQTWFRVRTLLPPAQPPAVAYTKYRALPPTKPGGACLSVFGPGVGPAAQAHPEPPGPGGSVIPPPAATVPVGGAGAATPTPAAAPLAEGSAPLATTSPRAPSSHPELALGAAAALLGAAVAAVRRRRALFAFGSRRLGRRTGGWWR